MLYMFAGVYVLFGLALANKAILALANKAIRESTLNRGYPIYTVFVCILFWPVFILWGLVV